MKSKDFIEKFGWDVCLKKDIWFVFWCQSERAFEEIYGFRIVEDLKQYTDAYELVQEYSGLVMAKRQYSCFVDASKSVGVNQSDRVLALGKSIQLVESIDVKNENQ